MFHLEKERIRNLISLFDYFKDLHTEEGSDFFCVCDDLKARTRIQGGNYREVEFNSS